MLTKGGLIAVTGVAGLLGRAVVAELVAAGFRVRGIDLVAPAAGSALARDHVTTDLTDYAAARAALAGCAAVVQLAAVPSPASGPPAEVWRINTTIAGNILTAAKECGIGDVVIASSQSALGLPYARSVVAPLYLPVDEDHPLRPSDTYSASKVALEQLAEALCREGGLDACCLRYPVIWNPARHDEHVAQRLGVLEQGAKSLWAYVDLRDAARATRLALEARRHGFQVLNITATRAFADEPVEALVEKWFPELTDIRGPVSGNAALFDWRRAAETIGFRAHYVWTKNGIMQVRE